MDEIALYDLPAIFARILAETGKDSKIIFVGHSLGTTLALMYAAEYPEEAQKSMKLFVMLSPAYTLKNMRSPYRNAVPFGDNIIVSDCIYCVIEAHLLLPRISSSDWKCSELSHRLNHYGEVYVPSVWNLHP